MHPVQRDAEREGVPLGGGHAHVQRAGQARAGRHRDRVDVAQGQPGPVQGLADHRCHRVDVGPGGDLRHHPAVAGVLGHRGGHRLPEQHAVPDQARARLVAGGLDPQHHPRPRHHTLLLAYIK